MNIVTIANSGQCFRLNKIDDKDYELVDFIYFNIRDF